MVSELLLKIRESSCIAEIGRTIRNTDKELSPHWSLPLPRMNMSMMVNGTWDTSKGKGA